MIYALIKRHSGLTPFTDVLGDRTKLWVTSFNAFMVVGEHSGDIVDRRRHPIH
jgi:hypothetical protein